MSIFSVEEFPIRFWRTKTGLEVDWVLGEADIAIEVKGSSRVDGADLRPLKAFCEEHKPRKAIVICNEPRRRDVDGIAVLPWADFMDELWSHKII